MEQLLNTLSALFTHLPCTITEEVKQEAFAQSIYALIGTDEDAIKIICKNVQIVYEQSEMNRILGSVPHVILKGLAAAIYYPEPIRRTLGDIDVIVPPIHFAEAYKTLQSAGYKTEDPLDGNARHVHFLVNGVTIELHRRYAELNSEKQEELLDGWIFNTEPVEGAVNGQQFPMLPEPLNGITLLAHISQHLENGLGLRQVLDWIMYVDKQLPDEKWGQFRALSDQLGLTKLAIVTARIGQLYLHAYPDYTWCSGNDQLANDLLEYIFSCGNFGMKLGRDNTVSMIMSHGKGIDGFFRNLQKRGEGNWKALEKHPELRPFAWLYQAGRYTKRGIEGRYRVEEIKMSMDESKRRNTLMEALGARQQTLRDKD